MKGSPFTNLCRGLAVLCDRGRADLHTHTTFSDGTHSPADLVERAVQAGLKALAVTDHDTVGGIELAQEAAGGRVEVIAGVEVTAEFRGAELHLLGYFFRPNDPALVAALTGLRAARRERALEMARQLEAVGAAIAEDVAAFPDYVSLGRRHLARLLIARGHAQSLHQAFTRWLAVRNVSSVPKRRLPVADAIALVRNAGGATSWAHPPANTDLRALEELRGFGLQAVECVYPSPSRSSETRMRQLVQAVGLAVTGGSDSHDPSPRTRAVGSRTVTLEEVDRIREMVSGER